MQKIKPIIELFDKYIQKGEKINDEIMQSEECIEKGVLTKNLKYSLYTYLTRSQKAILGAEFINSVEVYMLLQDLPEKMSGDIETHEAIDMISTTIGVFERSRNVDVDQVESELDPEEANKRVSERLKLIIKDGYEFINGQYQEWILGFRQETLQGIDLPIFEMYGLDFKKTYNTLLSWQKKIESLLDSQVHSEPIHNAFMYMEDNFSFFPNLINLEVVDQNYLEHKNDLFIQSKNECKDDPKASIHNLYVKKSNDVVKFIKKGANRAKEIDQVFKVFNSKGTSSHTFKTDIRIAQTVVDIYLKNHNSNTANIIYDNQLAHLIIEMFYLNVKLVEHSLGILDPQAKIEILEKKVESGKEEKEELRRSQGYGWASKMAHEIKNPISAVSKDIHSLHTYLENNSLLEDPIIKGKRYKVNEVLENAAKGANRISNFIAKVNEHGKLAVPTPAKSKLSDMETDIIKKYDSIKEKSDYEKAEIQINIEDKKLSINWDKEQIVQVFENLIGNSFLHGFSGFNGKKKITISMGVGEDDSVNIEYNNTGNKLSCEEEEYWQEFKTTNTEEGTGLGMSIVKEIITNHQGTITIDPSSFEKGHKLSITLPQDLNKADKKK